MALYDYMLLISGLLNALVFLYGSLLVVTKSIYRKHAQKHAACVEMVNERKISSLAALTTKALINMLTNVVMVITAVVLLVTSEVSFKPFFAYDANITHSMCFLLAVCIFNMVLLLLTETLSFRNIHEIPLYMVTSLVSITIVVKEEDAISGVICLFMFGSVYSDELRNLRAIKSDSTLRRPCSNAVHIFRMAMHLLCNFMFPVILFAVPACFTKEKFFTMEKSSIIIFFFAATFFVICNAWRLNCVFRQFLTKTKKEPVQDKTEEWCPNASVTAILVPTLRKKLSKSLPSLNVDGVFKKSNEYFMIEGSPRNTHVTQNDHTEARFDGQEKVLDTTVSVETFEEVIF